GRVCLRGARDLFDRADAAGTRGRPEAGVRAGAARRAVGRRDERGQPQQSAPGAAGAAAPAHGRGGYAASDAAAQPVRHRAAAGEAHHRVPGKAAAVALAKRGGVCAQPGVPGGVPGGRRPRGPPLPDAGGGRQTVRVPVAGVLEGDRYGEGPEGGGEGAGAAGGEVTRYEVRGTKYESAAGSPEKSGGFSVSEKL